MAGSEPTILRQPGFAAVEGPGQLKKREPNKRISVFAAQAEAAVVAARARNQPTIC
jgi:hypothetical protein